MIRRPTLALAALLGACSAAAAQGDACVTDYRSLPSDHGWRRWHVVDGRRCWYIEGHRGTFRRVATAAPSDRTAQAFVPRTPLAPPAIADPPPAIPAQLADDEHEFMSFYDDRFEPHHTVQTVRITAADPPPADPPPEDRIIGAIAALALILAGLIAIVVGMLQAQAARSRLTGDT
jgi:hypothetical protein